MPTIYQPYTNNTKLLLLVITGLITQIKNFGANKSCRKPISTNNITRTKRNRSKLQLQPSYYRKITTRAL
jgi:hypothetical protein